METRKKDLFDVTHFNAVYTEMFQKVYKGFLHNPKILKHVEGVPGSGKTELLVRDMIEKYRESQIVGVSAFNKKVPFMLRNRIYNHPLNKELNYLLDYPKLKKRVRTIDSIFLGYSFNEVAKCLGKTPHIANYRERVDIYTTAGLYNQEEHATSVEYGRYIYFIKSLAIDKLNEYFYEVIERLLTLQRVSGAILFEFLPYFAFEGLEKDGFTLPEVNYIFIDEHQDLSPTHLLVLKGANLYTYGDTNQTLYNFFGSDKFGEGFFVSKAKDLTKLTKTKRLPKTHTSFINFTFKNYPSMSTTNDIIEGKITTLIGSKEEAYDQAVKIIFKEISNKQKILLATLLNRDLDFICKKAADNGLLLLPNTLPTPIPIEDLVNILISPEFIPSNIIEFSGDKVFYMNRFKELYTHTYDGWVLKKDIGEYYTIKSQKERAIDRGIKLLNILKREIKEKEVEVNGLKKPLQKWLYEYIIKYHNKKAAVVKMGTIYQLKGEEAPVVIFLPTLPEESKFENDVFWQNAMYVGATRSLDELHILGWNSKYVSLLKQPPKKTEL